MQYGVECFGAEWLNKIKVYFKQFKITPDRAGKILASLRDSQEIWSIIEGFEDNINEKYWLQKQPIAMMGKTSDLFVLMDKYIERGRGLAAIISANQRLSEIPSTTLLYLLDIVVKEINSQDIQFDTMLSYYVKKVFDELKQRNDVSETDLAFKEMTYLP
ncbi:TPA: XRE family transcriptional regulator, partial [Escherichia coli]|nr:XRE family transcriptional regulator [Escherichia coli]